jgi:hypothetical protein
MTVMESSRHRDAQVLSSRPAEVALASPIEDPKVISRMRATFDLFDLAIKMQRQNLRRRHPDASPEEVASRLREWLQNRPGAEHGDASGPDFAVTSRFAHLLGRAGNETRE